MKEARARPRIRQLSYMPAALALLAVCFFAAGTVWSQTPRQVVVEGTLQVQHGDDFESLQAFYTFVLETAAGESLSLDVGERAEEALALAGAPVRVTGLLQGDGLVVQQLQADGTGEATAVGSAGVAGARKVLIVLLNFQDDSSEPWTPAEARGIVFTNPDSVNAYYQEVSGGLVSLIGNDNPDGDIFGWYTVAYNNWPCWAYDWRDEANIAATAAGFDLASYDHIAYTFPYTTSCGWNGLAWLRHPHSYLNGALNLRVTSHEFGHNLGLYHANSRSCTDSGGQRVPISGTCTGAAYGDPFDVMGGALTRHLHNRFKGQLGFLPAANILTLGPGDHTLTIVSSEQPAVGQLQELQIPRWMGPAKVTYYSLDFRQPYGTYFDDFSPDDPAVNGVAIRITDTPPNSAWLLDGTPATADFTDAPLPAGATLTDAQTGISITTLSVSPTGASVRVVVDDDTDNDGCDDAAENSAEPGQGGQRDPADSWDFFDTPDDNNVRDRAITISDVFRVAGRFGTTGISSLIDPLSQPPESGYHTAYDRGLQTGANSWNRAPADGAISIEDVFAVAAQFGVDCS
jgi:hypothetical protein